MALSIGRSDLNQTFHDGISLSYGSNRFCFSAVRHAFVSEVDVLGTDLYTYVIVNVRSSYYIVIHRDAVLSIAICYIPSRPALIVYTVARCNIPCPVVSSANNIALSRTRASRYHRADLSRAKLPSRLLSVSSRYFATSILNQKMVNQY